MSEKAAAQPALAKVAAAGIAWTTAQTWVSRLGGMATVVILARLLSPEDFGVVAIAMALPPILQLIADMGLSTYILQAERPTRRTYSTFFWYSATAGVVLSGLLLAAAPVVGAVLDTPEVVPISAALAPVALFVVLGSVPVTMLRREMRFRVIALQTVVASIASQIVAVTLALTGFGAWALVWQTLTFQFIVLVLAWFSSRFRPRFAFSVAEFVEMTRFGVKVVGTQVLGAAAIWAVNAIIVGALGTATLGYLNIAQRLITLAQELTTNALGMVSTVLFARIRNDRVRLRGAFLRSLSISYAVAIPPMVLVAVGAPQIIPIVFGEQWGDSVVPAQLLAVAAVFASLAGVDYSLFIALGKPGTWFVYFVAIDLIVVGVTALVVSQGLVAYAVGYAAAAVLATAVRWVMLGRQLSSPWWRIAEPFARTALPSACAAAVGVGVGALTAEWPALLALIAMGSAMLVVYLPLIRLTSPEAWSELSRLLGGAVRRLRPRAKEVRADA
ncbi:lipopolysaccharide biosynthesis protein [Microbacterium oryzae]|uniref:lipopolysaccharide biosynthesis protein n=1 Tax=Microbacterium oryzae TaxID=743009 RepID=UPI0025B13773|nr:lipopolysaccharide biosynthesis protein [Microbacterium oryzae]MDN3310110.1 lipopolysaccharide biosynthesis protein [Microbacterium oryzae]